MFFWFPTATWRLKLAFENRSTQPPPVPTFVWNRRLLESLGESWPVTHPANGVDGRAAGLGGVDLHPQLLAGVDLRLRRRDGGERQHAEHDGKDNCKSLGHSSSQVEVSRGKPGHAGGTGRPRRLFPRLKPELEPRPISPGPSRAT